jgi:hypothetical protein
MLVAVGGDQLRRDPHPVAGSTDGPLDDGLHTQLLGDLRQVAVGALVGHGGGPGDHSHSADRSQPSHYVFRHAVAEVLVVGIAAQVRERQHHDIGSIVGPALPRDGPGGFGPTCRRRSPDPFGGDLQRPGEDQGDWKTHKGEHEDQGVRPIGNSRRGQNKVRRLPDDKGHRRVGHRHAVDPAPLELGREVAEPGAQWTPRKLRLPLSTSRQDADRRAEAARSEGGIRILMT